MIESSMSHPFVRIKIYNIHICIYVIFYMGSCLYIIILVHFWPFLVTFRKKNMARVKGQGPVHKQNQANYKELELQFKSIRAL